MDDTAIVEELRRSIVERDFGRIAACFAPEALMRVLTPRSLREETGPEAIAERYRAWVGAFASYAVISSDVEQIADRVRLRYRFHGRDPEKGWQENEHTAYATVVDGLVAALNVSCAGFRPVEPPS
jgi:hypothetical protein